VVIHILLDGMTGVYKLNPVFTEQYAELDKRYGAPIGSFLGSAVHVISALELFVYGPLCVYLYMAYHKRYPSRDAVELVVCVCQLFGTIVYLGQEVISGMTSMEVDWDFTFTYRMLKNFWFAVVIGNSIWLIVPTYLGVKSFNRIVAAATNEVPPAKRESTKEVAEAPPAPATPRGKRASSTRRK
jgi:hypothetical protein